MEKHTNILTRAKRAQRPTSKNQSNEKYNGYKENYNTSNTCLDEFLRDKS